MNKFEYDSFYKFLVSLGIILISVPFVVFNFFLKENNVLLINKSDLIQFTDISQKIIENKQFLAYKLTIYLPYIGCMFILFGIALLILGSIKWYKMQKLNDDKQRLENKQLELNIEKMTITEVVEKAQNEVNDNEFEAETVNGNLNSRSRSGAMLRYLEIEEKAYLTISAKYKNSFDVKRNVRVNHVEFDIIARSIKNRVDYIFEIKYLKDLSPYKVTYLHAAIDKVIMATKIYTNATSREAKPILLVVVSNESIDNWNEIIKNVNFRDVTFMFISESEIINGEWNGDIIT